MEQRLLAPDTIYKPLSPEHRNVNSVTQGQGPALTLPFCKPASSVTAMKEKLEKSGREESQATRLAPLAPPKLQMFKSPPSGSPAQRRESVSEGMEVNRDKQMNSVNMTLPKPPPSWRKPALDKQDTMEQQATDNEAGCAEPQNKPLPSIASLGARPAKPKRPPHVDVYQFSSQAVNSSSSGPANTAPEGLLPAPPPPQNPPPPTDFTFPPPPISMTDEENYDDVCLMNAADSQPGQSSNEFEGDFDDIYEDIEEKWSEQEKPNKTKKADETKKGKELKEQKKKMEKEERKEAEREKKEKKEQEKREQEARKKFKLKGPIEVLHEARVKTNCKGGKLELALEQGENVDIVRKRGNSEGRWLVRNSRGCYGYVKTDLLDIVSTTQQQEEDSEDYDDVADHPSNLNKEVGGEDIYNAVEESVSDICFPPPPPDFTAADGDTYDDVMSQGFPPPPPPPSLSQFNSEQMDPKKKKKIEKEEREFRKKFKYTQEIQVLYDVTILPTLACKKFGSKDLVVKPGEVISVIMKPKDGKLIGRNSEGKFGFVSVSNVQQDSDIYDDVGEDCVYDND